MPRISTFAVVLLGVLVLAELAVGATLAVRKDGTGDFDVIQDALDVAADGDTILVGPGEYLEETSFRPPGWGYDIRAYGQVKSNDLTIIGAGIGFTTIGPSNYLHDGDEFNPKGFAYSGGSDFHIQDVTIRNCHDGIWMLGRLFLLTSEFRDNYAGIAWETTSSGGWMKNSEFAGIRQAGVFPTSVDVVGVGSDILIQNCQFDNAKAIVENVQDLRFHGCSFENRTTGADVYGDAYVVFRDCEMTNISITGINLFFSGGTCEIWDSVISGGLRALRTNPGGRFLVENSVLIGGTTAVVYATQNPGPCVINNCDLVKGDGPVILCDDTISPVTHDLTNNYWGTTEASDIEEWIVDINDDPGVLATVLFEPFSTDPLPVEEGQKSFGGVKAMFR